MPELKKNMLLEGKSFLEYETEIVKKHLEKANSEIVQDLQDALHSICLLAQLKSYASSQGLRFIGYRCVSFRLSNGDSVRVDSPSFHRLMPYDGRRKHYHSKTIYHLGLDYFGIIGKCSPLLLQRIVPLAALCPSFDVAAQIAQSFGIKLYQRFLRAKFNHFATEALPMRENGLVDEAYKQPGLRILINIDAGRVRTPTKRRGSKPKGAKRQGFHTNWREPHIITISLFDQCGKPLKNIPIICDGRFDGQLDDAFELLKKYLQQMNLAQAEEIVFCSDKGNGIWPRTHALIESLNLNNATCVVDYTHAKQNFNYIINIFKDQIKPNAKQLKALTKKLKNWLFHGEIESIENYIKEQLRYKRGKAKALKKLNDYFDDAAKFKYQQYRSQGIPIGSGIVESAIRRVINLRIKGPGIFWYRENAENMIFLRAQILTGRWQQVCNHTFNSFRRVMNDFILNEEELAA